MTDSVSRRDELARIIEETANAKKTQLYEHECFTIADRIIAESGWITPEDPPTERITRIPLTIIATGSGVRTEGVLVGVFASELNALEGGLRVPDRETLADVLASVMDAWDADELTDDDTEGEDWALAEVIANVLVKKYAGASVLDGTAGVLPVDEETPRP